MIIALAAFIGGCVKNVPDGQGAVYSLQNGQNPSAAQSTSVAAPVYTYPADWIPKAKGEPNENGLHDPAVELEGFPKDAQGNINWVKALDGGKFSPKGSLNPQDPAIKEFDFDVLRFPAGSMPDVVYPHKAHTQILDCWNCHPKIFEMKAGANPITMVKIMQGEYCGRCHGKVSFPLNDCFRCHKGQAKG